MERAAWASGLTSSISPNPFAGAWEVRAVANQDGMLDTLATTFINGNHGRTSTD
jgi:hypothetical protein